MVVALTAAEPVIKEIPWDLYHWLVQTFTLRGNALAAVLIGISILCMLIPYFMGSINPAIMISKLVYHDDIRLHGSGNAGSTNMLRTYGKKAAVATFAGDILKAALAVVIGGLLMGQSGASIAGFFVGFGHMFPAYYRFRGGKGVACYATVALMISPFTFLGILSVFIIVLVGTKFVSLASVMAALLYPLFMNAFSPNFSLAVAMAVVEACFVVFMHRENLRRIWNHEESRFDFSKLKIGKKKKKQAESAAEDGEDGENHA